MKVCFPIQDSQGLESALYGHFGSAPGFVVVESSTMEFEEVKNGDLHHSHGMCQPLKALGRRKVDAVVVTAIGLGALQGLQSRGITVYRASEGTVRNNMELFQEKKLLPFEPGQVCAGHKGGGCAHS